jgi:transposase
MLNRATNPMAKKPLSMRHIHEILRLKHEKGLSVREIARSCGLPASTVGDYLKRAETASLSWPLPESLNQEELLDRLIGGGGEPDNAAAELSPPRPLPEWAKIHQELRRKGVTLQLLWREYRQDHPEGYGRSRFCELYRQWASTVDPVLRQHHEPGEKMFVDWAGQKVPIYNSQNGCVDQASVFIAVLGASNMTYAEAFANEQSPSWIKGHMNAFRFYRGVPRAVVPDNPKTAVIRPCRYEPGLNRNYQEMAEHYGTVILPARPLKPRDKAKVETGVQIAEREILAVLRDQRFFTVGALNQAMVPLLAQINDRPFQKLPGSRNSWFEAHEKGQLQPLPALPFELATWSRPKVNIDYHVVVDKHYYSVPYQLIHQWLDARMTEATVEVFHQGKRIAAHRRSRLAGRYTTVGEHRPKAHQKHLEWTPSRILQWAATIGPQCAQLIQHIMDSRPHPEQGFRSALGIIRLGKGVGNQRLEAACQRALRFDACSYRSVSSILANHLEAQPLEPESPLDNPHHGNVRGPQYYSDENTLSQN